jgi:hypothetical protein
LELPTSIAFIGANDLFALEKNTGRVLRVTNGVVRGDVLDLSVNNFSERGCSESRSIRTSRRIPVSISSGRAEARPISTPIHSRRKSIRARTRT